MWARSHSQKEEALGRWDPQRTDCSQLRKERPREGRLLAQGHAGDCDGGLQTSQDFHRGHPHLTRAWPPPIVVLREGTRIPPSLPLRRLSIRVSLRAQPCTPPQPPALRKERPAFAAPLGAPHPQPTDGSACARPPKPVQEPRGEGAALAGGAAPVPPLAPCALR